MFTDKQKIQLLAKHVEVLTPRNQNIEEETDGSSPSQELSVLAENANASVRTALGLVIEDEAEERRPQSSPEILVLGSEDGDEEEIESAVIHSVDEVKAEGNGWDENAREGEDESGVQGEVRNPENSLEEKPTEMEGAEVQKEKPLQAAEALLMKKKLVHLIAQFKKVKELLATEKVWIYFFS